ncbi:hypothetical protein ACOZ2I_003812, partial [Shigella flexneri]
TDLLKVPKRRETSRTTGCKQNDFEIEYYDDDDVAVRSYWEGLSRSHSRVSLGIRLYETTGHPKE